MQLTLLCYLWAAPLAQAAILPRQDPGYQQYPSEPKEPDTFAQPGVAMENGMPPLSKDQPPALYGVRSGDLPFGRIFHGNMKYFPDNQVSTKHDSANHSACGIPDQAYANSKVAIHPYFLKYAGLDRYCMQDVCVSFWREDGKSDMMAKVTDICSTDPNDPSSCSTPEDIKLIRNKVQTMEKLGRPLTGTQFPNKTYWYFAKCWGDGTAQPPYKFIPPPQENDTTTTPFTVTNNWFTTPLYPNNKDWALSNDVLIYREIQKSYPAKGWETYPYGFYTLPFESRYKPLEDWVPGQEPAYKPIAGGRGFGDHADDGDEDVVAVN